jgi:hypothetical protein
MLLLEPPTTISEKVERLFRPVFESGPCQSSVCSAEDWRSFDLQLIHWERHPDELEEEGIAPPNGRAVSLIREVRNALQELGVEPPLRIVPNCDGGAVFEWRDAPLLWLLEVERDGSLELSVFRAARLITRYRLA